MFKKNRFVFISAILVLTLIGCTSFGYSDRYQEYGIRLVTHPALVQGMVMINGYSRTAGVLEGSTNQLARYYANEAAKYGYRNCTVLVVLKSQGSNTNEYEVTIWK